MYSEHGFLLLFLAITAFLFVRAYTKGVVGMLWAVIGVSLGILGGYLFFQFLPPENGFRGRLFLSAIVGLVVYSIARKVTKSLLTRLFDKEGLFDSIRIGLGGGLLSLIPSLITILILAYCVRIGGTMTDLKRYEKISIPGVDFLARDYPGRPFLAKWQDGVERLSLVTRILYPFDPYSRSPERKVVGLLIASKKPELFSHLSEDPESKSILVSAAMKELLNDPEIRKLNEERQHYALLRDERIRSAALAKEIRPAKELELHRLIDEFMLSPERQYLLESFQRR